MSSRRVLCVLIVLLFPLFSACSTTLPPYLENGVYVNSKYDFSLDILKNWKITGEEPNWLKEISDEMSSNKVIILENNESKGTIFLIGKTTSFNIDNFRWADTRFKRSFSEGFYGGFVDTFEKNEALSRLQGDIFEYDVYRWGARNSPPEFAYYRWEGHRKGLIIKEEGRFFIDSCKNNKTCVVILILVSDDDQFHINYDQYLEIVKSIKIGIVR